MEGWAADAKAVFIKDERAVPLVYNKKNKNYIMRRAVLIITCIMCLAAVLYGVYAFSGGSLLKRPAYASAQNSDAPQSNLVPVARAKLGMKQGELLNVGKAELIEVPADIVPPGTITDLSKLNNMRLKRDIAEKEFLNNIDLMPENAVFKEGDRLIEHNFAEGAVPAVVAEGSAIDIKLFDKGGKDRVVIAKAIVISRNSGLLSFYMNEQEQEFIKEAASEGMLFAVKYIDSSQKASEITYVPLYDKEKK